jgi:hypothetical protein
MDDDSGRRRQSWLDYTGAETGAVSCLVNLRMLREMTNSLDEVRIKKCDMKESSVTLLLGALQTGLVDPKPSLCVTSVVSVSNLIRSYSEYTVVPFLSNSTYLLPVTCLRCVS